jgi:DNA-binding NarL/FixJ family response regulator
MMVIAKVPKKILCIEHDRETARLIAEELTARGFQVLVTHEGRDGLIAILKGVTDIVLCDSAVPGMSGFEVLARLNELSPRLEGIPFVFLLARRNRALELRARRLGANGFVVKPIDFDVLHMVIDAQLAGSARNESGPTFVELNDRELETLTWAARGRTSSEIAKALGLVKRTVDFHLDNARVKLRARTRTEAVFKAAFDRLIKP